MKKILISLIILIGASLFFYPKIAQYFSEKNASFAVQTYSEEVTEIDAETIAEEFQKARDYNKALSGENIGDPFMQGSGVVLSGEYQDILNIGGTMGYLVVPKIDVNLPIYHGTADSVLQKGIGHLEGTSFPVGGHGTNAVLTAHTGLNSAKLFTNLSEMKDGDIFYLNILNETLAYQVDQIKVVEPLDTSALKPVKGEDYVTLVTCTPYGINSHRLLVRGRRIPYDPETAQAQAAKATVFTAENRLLLTAALTTSAVMLVFILFAVLIRRRINTRAERRNGQT